MPFPSYEEHLRQVHRYAVREGFAHGWPNFEAAVSPEQGLVYGSCFLRIGESLEHRDIYRLRAVRSPDFPLLRSLIGGAEGPPGSDLLSYFFFDREFIDRSTRLGQQHALYTLERLPGGDTFGR